MPEVGPAWCSQGGGHEAVGMAEERFARLGLDNAKLYLYHLSKTHKGEN